MFGVFYQKKKKKQPFFRFFFLTLLLKKHPFRCMGRMTLVVHYLLTSLGRVNYSQTQKNIFSYVMFKKQLEHFLNMT